MIEPLTGIHYSERIYKTFDLFSMRPQQLHALPVVPQNEYFFKTPDNLTLPVSIDVTDVTRDKVFFFTIHLLQVCLF